MRRFTLAPVPPTPEARVGSPSAGAALLVAILGVLASLIPFVVAAAPVGAAIGSPSSLVTLYSPKRIYDSRLRHTPGYVAPPEIDTRTFQTLPALGATAALLTRGQPQNIRVRNGGSVPVEATAVVLNVTITAPATAGYLSLWSAGEPWPGTSSLNFAPKQTIANLVIAPVTSNYISLMTSAASTDVAIDLFGYYAPGADGNFVDVDPYRVADTRTTTPLGSREERVLLRAQRPTTTAFLLNVTVIATTPTYLAVAPTGVWNGTSNLNADAGQTVANLVLARVGTDGGVSFINGSGETHVVVDVVGFYDAEQAGAGGATVTLSPARILDSRDGTGQGRVQPLGPGETLSVDVHNHPGLAAAVVPGYALVNVTATDATIGGYLTMWASDRPKPFVSSLNPVPGRIVPNMVLVPVGADGRFNIFNAFGSVHVIVDMVGFVQPSAAGLFPDAVTVTANFAEAHVSWPAPQAPRSKLPDRYRVRLSNSFGTIAETTVPGDRFTAVLPNNNLGPGERIHASVAAEIDRGGSSYRSAFTHGTTVVDSSAWRPSLVRLFDGIVPVLSWPEVGVATGYDVTAVPADGGTQQSWWVGEDPDTWDASVWLTDLRPGVQYHVFVRAVNHTSTSDWTPALLVERAAAQLSGQWPLLGARTGNVFLVDPVTGDVTVIAPSVGRPGPSAPFDSVADGRRHDPRRAVDRRAQRRRGSSGRGRRFDRHHCATRACRRRDQWGGAGGRRRNPRARERSDDMGSRPDDRRAGAGWAAPRWQELVPGGQRAGLLRRPSGRRAQLRHSGRDTGV